MDSASTDGITTRYRYNGRGERLIKTSSVNTSYYVYDEQGHLLGEYDGSGKPIQETVYLGDLPVAVVSPGASGPAITYIYADHLQAPRVLTQASDNRMVWRWDQADPFDLTQPDENPSGLGKFTYNLRFPGQVFDRETNNHYNYHRDYDPQLGRYIESDPIGLNGGINTYAYGLGNPVSNVDPEGLFVPLLIPGLCAAGGCEALLAGAAILMSPPGQKAIKSGADAIAKSCTPDDLDRCEKAKQDARFRYRTLVNKRIPQYLGGGTRGSDANHYA